MDFWQFDENGVNFVVSPFRIWANCCRYNGADALGGVVSEYYAIGLEAREHYMKKWKKILQSKEKEMLSTHGHSTKRQPVQQLPSIKIVDKTKSISGLNKAQLQQHAKATGRQQPNPALQAFGSKPLYRDPPQPSGGTQSGSGAFKIKVKGFGSSSGTQTPAEPQVGEKRAAPSESVQPKKFKIKIKGSDSGQQQPPPQAQPQVQQSPQPQAAPKIKLKIKPRQ